MPPLSPVSPLDPRWRRSSSSALLFWTEANPTSAFFRVYSTALFVARRRELETARRSQLFAAQKRACFVARHLKEEEGEEKREKSKQRSFLRQQIRLPFCRRPTAPAGRDSAAHHQSPTPSFQRRCCSDGDGGYCCHYQASNLGGLASRSRLLLNSHRRPTAWLIFDAHFPAQILERTRRRRKRRRESEEEIVVVVVVLHRKNGCRDEAALPGIGGES